MRSQTLKRFTLPALLAGLTVLGVSAVDGSERARATVNWLSSELNWLIEVQQSTRQARKNAPPDQQPQRPVAAEVVEARIRPIAELSPAAEAEVVEARVRPIEEVRSAAAPVAAPEVTAAIVSIDEVRARLAAMETRAPRASSADKSATSPESKTGSDAVASRVAGMGALMASASVPPDQLGGLRGGFEMPSGLRMSFGIERVVMINGVLQSTTSLRVEDLGRAVGGKAAPESVVPGTALAVIQSGPNNIVAAPLPGTTLATVVQNSLDNQKLQTVTTVNATVNSMEVVRGLRMHQSMQEAVNRAAQMR